MDQEIKCVGVDVGLNLGIVTGSRIAEYSSTRFQNCRPETCSECCYWFSKYVVKQRIIRGRCCWKRHLIFYTWTWNRRLLYFKLTFSVLVWLMPVMETWCFTMVAIASPTFGSWAMQWCGRSLTRGGGQIFTFSIDNSFWNWLFLRSVNLNIPLINDLPRPLVLS